MGARPAPHAFVFAALTAATAWCAVATAAAEPRSPAPSGAPSPPSASSSSDSPPQCTKAQYLPLSAFISKAARDHLAGGHPPPAPARRGPPAPGSLSSYRAEQAAGWKPHSERYRAAYLARSNLTALGGVPTVYAEPRPGLLPNGKPAPAGDARAASGGAPSALLFLHGGAYMFGDPRYMAFAYAPLAAAAGMRVYAPDYRKAPEYRFPAALDDALAAYKALVKTYGAARVAVAGDSAGGGLAAALVLRAAAEGVPLPAAVVLSSPWSVLKVGSTDTATTLRCADPAINLESLYDAARGYAGNASLDAPLLSPAFADWAPVAAAAAKAGRGPPAVLISAGTREVLLSDAVLLRAAMKRGGLDVGLVPYEGMWHSFNTYGSPGALDVPETAEVTGEFADHIRAHIPRA